MNPRLAKEVRDLLPALGGALLLIALPYAVWGKEAGGFGFAALALGCIILGASAFGNEFQYRTIPLLLSQPLDRRVLWRDKMLVLGAGLLLSVGTLWACFCLCCAQYSRGGDSLVALALIPLCAFCGAPWLTLRVRNGIAGAVFALAVPGLLLTLTALVVERLLNGDDALFVTVLVVVLMVYCALTFWRGYAGFQKLQAIDGSGPELRLPARLETLLEAPLRTVAGRWSGVFATLVKKELRLQQICFLGAALFLILAIILQTLEAVWPGWGRPLLVAEYGIYVLVLPLVAGGMAGAEERAWGLSGWQLTLPPSAARLWLAKSLTALATSVGLVLVLPIALAVAGVSFWDSHPDDRQWLWLAVWLLGLGITILTSSALYASAFSNSTLKAILIGAMLLLAICACMQLGIAMATEWLSFYSAAIYLFPDSAAFHRLLLGSITPGLLLLLGFLQAMSLANFRRSDWPVRRFVFQVLLLLVLGAAAGAGFTLVAALVC